jgi:hypothetical protein
MVSLPWTSVRPGDPTQATLRPPGMTGTVLAIGIHNKPRATPAGQGVAQPLRVREPTIGDGRPRQGCRNPSPFPGCCFPPSASRGTEDSCPPRGSGSRRARRRRGVCIAGARRTGRKVTVPTRYPDPLACPLENPTKPYKPIPVSHKRTPTWAGHSGLCSRTGPGNPSAFQGSLGIFPTESRENTERKNQWCDPLSSGLPTNVAGVMGRKARQTGAGERGKTQ